MRAASSFVTGDGELCSADKELIKVSLLRKTARVVLINEQHEVLLLKYSDKEALDPSRPNLLTYWIPPGGGVEAGETFEAAATREIREELGLKIELGQCIWSRELDLVLKGDLCHIIEKYFLARCHNDFDLTMLARREGVVTMRWWTLPEIRTAQENILPPELSDLLDTHA